MEKSNVTPLIKKEKKTKKEIRLGRIGGFRAPWAAGIVRPSPPNGLKTHGGMKTVKNTVTATAATPKAI